MDSCRLCESKSMITLLDLGKHPIAHRFLERNQEEYVHLLKLCFCEKCGHIQLDDPIPPELLYTNYVCLSSWKYQPHIPRLVELIEKIAGTKKESNILEVGSNDGRFLQFLHEQGYQKLVGIEPAQDAQQSAQEKNVKTIPSYFNLQTAKEYVSDYGKCALFISRQMLEHINDLSGFREAMQAVLSPGAFVIFEVPDFSTSLNASDYTLWEEHVNYFTIETLGRFLSSAGIQILHNETILFSGNALVVVGKYTGEPSGSSTLLYMDGLKRRVIKYRDRWPLFRDSFIQYLKEHKRNGGKVAAYGAGARLCSLINYVGLGPYIEFIVDDQLEKQGKLMPGSKLPILRGEALEEHPIDLCLLAVNAECDDMVIAKHPAFIKRGGVFVSVLPPSKRLPDFWKEFSDLKYDMRVQI